MEQTIRQSKHIVRPSDIIYKTVVYIILTVGAFTMVFPYFWMLMSSFKSDFEAISLELVIFPEKFMFSNYSRVMDMIPFMKGVGNTVLVEVSVVAIGTFVTAMAAFSFAKLKLKFKTTLLLILMSGMMVPYAVLMLPQFRAFMALNMYNTLWPLILPGFFGNVTMMFFFVQYMKGIPSAFFEAAKIDGAGYMTMFVRIMLPLIKPAIAAQVIFWFMGIWNDYFAPSIYLKTYDTMTLQPMLAKLSSDNAGGTNLPLVMTGAVLSSIPMLAIYVGFQRFFIQSLAISGVKG